MSLRKFSYCLVPVILETWELMAGLEESPAKSCLEKQGSLYHAVEEIDARVSGNVSEKKRFGKENARPKQIFCASTQWYNSLFGKHLVVCQPETSTKWFIIQTRSTKWFVNQRKTHSSGISILQTTHWQHSLA